MTTRRLIIGGGCLLVLIVVVVLLHRASGGDGFGLVASATGEWAYLVVFGLVFGDAICALLPGETTLNAAATLAANGQLDLVLVMVAGALGAVLGDTAVYWIAREGGKRLDAQLERARKNKKVASALVFLGSSAPVLLVAGRYVPGLRLAVNASLGLSRYPYRRFLLWSSIGGVLWSVYTCGLAYLVSTALSNYPLGSIVISGVITTLALGAIFIVLRRRRRDQHDSSPGSSAPAAP